jgi:hypothetical protein
MRSKRNLPGWSEDDKDSAGDALTNALKALGTDFDELRTFKRIKVDLLRMLGE